MVHYNIITTYNGGRGERPVIKSFAMATILSLLKWLQCGYNFKSFEVAAMHLLLIEIYRRGGSMALSKNVAHYGLWSGFLYYNMTT
jgi:hypothetical protein